MKHPAKLETAKGGMDALPICIFLQVLPHACGHLYCAARQGAFIFHNPHPHHKAESTTVYRPACECARYTSTCFAVSGDTTHASTNSRSMLTLAMQSGTFLHLVVTLTALVARIAHLSSAVRSALSALHTECAHLFAKLDVCSKWPFALACASDRLPK